MKYGPKIHYIYIYIDSNYPNRTVYIILCDGTTDAMDNIEQIE